MRRRDVPLDCSVLITVAFRGIVVIGGLCVASRSYVGKKGRRLVGEQMRHLVEIDQWRLLIDQRRLIEQVGRGGCHFYLMADRGNVPLSSSPLAQIYSVL